MKNNSNAIYLIIVLFLFLPGGFAFGAEREAVVVGSGVNVRLGPGTNFGVIFAANTGFVVRVLSEEGEWALVHFDAGGSTKEGWVHNGFLRYLAEFSLFNQEKVCSEENLDFEMFLVGKDLSCEKSFFDNFYRSCSLNLSLEFSSECREKFYVDFNCDSTLVIEDIDGFKQTVLGRENSFADIVGGGGYERITITFWNSVFGQRWVNAQVEDYDCEAYLSN